jgi:Tc5 transposase DNA-binding domain
MQQNLKIQPSLSSAYTMDYNARIANGISDLESQNPPQYTDTAKKWNVDKSALWRRCQGQTISRKEATSGTRSKLTNVQEETLVTHINKLSERGLPQTPQIVKNLAEEIAKREVGKNWVARFCQRHSHGLSSFYLRTIDQKRKQDCRQFPSFRTLFQYCECFV